jgi:hypothetical protein
MISNRKKIDALLRSISEELASIEHERWSHWQRYMHSKAKIQPDGSMIFSAELIGRWEKQAATSYADLSEREKKSDREQVRRYSSLIATTLATGSTFT